MTNKKSFTFIHTADWHIGNSFARFDAEKRKRLNRAIFLTIEMIFVYADKNRIPLILCAGDVVDNGQLAGREDLFKLFEIVRKYPGIKMVMIAGNHDPLVPQNIYSRVERANFPDNLHLVRSDETLHYPDWNLVVWASSLLEKKGNYNPLAWVEGADIDKTVINVGLCHGSLKVDVFDTDNFPIEPDAAERLGLDYMALGDWHSYKKVNSRTYYPGVPEPLQMKDDGSVLKVTIAGPGALPQVERTQIIPQYTWLEMDETVNADNFQAFKARLEGGGDKEIRKLSVAGYLPLDVFKSYKELIAMNRGRYMEINDTVSIKPDDRELVEAADGFMSDVVRRLIELKESGDPLPDGILDAYATAGQGEVFKQADSLTKDEIIDNALLSIYGYFKEKHQ